MARAGFWAIENMTIRFGRDGRWYSDDEPIENRRIADLFSRHVTRDGDGGWWLVIGDEHARIVVDDTAWVVVRVDGDPARGFTIELNDGIREELSTGSLRLGDGHAVSGDNHHRTRQLKDWRGFLRSHRADGAIIGLARRPGGKLTKAA